MRLLAIETSCDDTAVSIVESLPAERFRVLGYAAYSQISTHRKFGGVVPEVAAREHAVTIVPTLRLAFSKSRIPLGDVDVIAVTTGPGLITSLRIGVDAARLLSAVWKKPLIGVNHIEGHLYSPWPVEPHALLRGAEPRTGVRRSRTTGARASGLARVRPNPRPILPALSLIVSGGHTELILLRGHGMTKLLGRTRDDAAGEAFDKVAKMLKLPYPGGPQLARLGEYGNAKAFNFPRPMIASRDLDFSFAGLKTAVLYALRGRKLTPKLIRDVAAAFQQTVVDVLVAKTIAATKLHLPKTVLLGGGVAANRLLRRSLTTTLKRLRVPLRIAPLPLCMDNATMIAMAASFRARRRDYDRWQTLRADPDWEIK